MQAWRNHKIKRKFNSMDCHEFALAQTLTMTANKLCAPFLKNSSQQRQIKQNSQKFSRTDRQNTNHHFQPKSRKFTQGTKALKTLFATHLSLLTPKHGVFYFLAFKALFTEAHHAQKASRIDFAFAQKHPLSYLYR